MEISKNPKVAIIHDYLLQYGGAERTLEAILELFPEAPIYTGIYSQKGLPEAINKRRVISAKNPLTRLFSKHLSFLMPLVFENFDLNKYDLVISDSSCWAKGVLTKPDQLHISYIHTPPRFLYKYSVESPARFKWYYRPIVAILDHFLRIWDYCAAQRPDFLITNSETTRKRVKKFYGRDAKIINPPTVATIRATTNKDVIQKPYFCSLGRLASYKNVDLLIQAFNVLGWELTVLGTGSEEKSLRKMANSNVKILGRVTDETKDHILANCKGLIFPVVEEDWGIVPLEAMAHGKPVLAHRSGGVTETIQEGVTGMFFESLRLEDFINSIKGFSNQIDAEKFDPERIKRHASSYTKEKFQKEFIEFVKEKWSEHAGIS